MMESKRLNYIDALRGMAVLGVLLIHNILYGSNHYDPFFAKIISFGPRGVQLFYIISAFTLFLSYHIKQDEPNRNINFFIRRFFRIAPLFYFATIYYLWQNALGDGMYNQGGLNPSPSALNVLANLSFLNQFNPYWINSIVFGGWSVTVEMSFYLFIPVMAKYITDINRAMLFFAVTLFNAFVWLFLLRKYPLITDKAIWENFVFFGLPFQLPVFALGIIIYFLIKKQSSTREISLNIFLLLVILAITSTGILPSHISFSVFLGLLIYVLSVYPIKFLVNRGTCFIGKISFGIYLFHYAVLYWMNRIGLVDLYSPGNSYDAIINYCIRLFILLLCSSLLAYLLHISIERFGLKLGKRIIIGISEKVSDKKYDMR